jgi:hypothetical protein
MINSELQTIKIGDSLFKSKGDKAKKKNFERYKKAYHKFSIYEQLLKNEQQLKAKKNEKVQEVY